MRHDVLYQYDLPVELLDDVSSSEEVLEVIFARTDERHLVPILLTRERIVWAYPDEAAAYRVFDLQYVDIVVATARYATPSFPTLSFATVNGQQYQFHHLQDSKEDMRGKFMTLCGVLKTRFGGNWRVWHKRNLFVDEYLVDSKAHRDAEEVAGMTLCEPEPSQPEDVFEEKPLPGKGCFESNESLFSHFPGAADVFEESEYSLQSADPYAGADAKIARIVEEVTSEMKQNETVEKIAQATVAELDDTVVYASSSGKKDEQQWASSTHISGDAQILSEDCRSHNLQSIRELQYATDEDDSIIYGEPRKPTTKKERRDSDPPVRLTAIYAKEDDDSIIYPTSNDEPVVITPMVKPKPEFEPIDVGTDAVITPLQPRPSYEIGDEAEVAPRSEMHAGIPVGSEEYGAMPIDVSLAEEPVAVPDAEPAFAKASTLQPREEFDSATVDRLLEELRHLCDSGLITQEEYRERSLKLFRNE